MEKLERDGKVAVIVSPGFGAGWSTWDYKYGEALVFDPEIASALLDGDLSKAVLIAQQKFPEVYLGGLDDAEVQWVGKGQQFEINEYDGNETLHIIGENSYMTA